MKFFAFFFKVLIKIQKTQVANLSGYQHDLWEGWGVVNTLRVFSKVSRNILSKIDSFSKYFTVEFKKIKFLRINSIRHKD